MKPVRTREKPCDACGAVSPVLYRVRRDKTRAWVFLCGPCRTVAATRPRYVYGGTWKANKRH